MTNYRLEEFKQGLEENPQRKENLPHGTKYLTEFTNDNQNFQNFVQASLNPNFDGPYSKKKITSVQPYREIFQKFVEEREQKEKNAQEGLDEKFPTPESKAQVKQLLLHGDNNSDQQSNGKFTFYRLNLTGELELNNFSNLTLLYIRRVGVNQIKLVQLPELSNFDVSDCNNLVNVEGLENCPKIVKVYSSNVNPFTFLDRYKQEINQLKAQLAEHEQQETGSTASNESLTDIQTLLNKKRQELNQNLTSNKKSNAHLRKEIKYLEKLQKAEERIQNLEAEMNEQGQTNNLQENGIQEKNNLEKQIKQLTEQVNKLEIKKNQATATSKNLYFSFSNFNGGGIVIPSCSLILLTIAGKKARSIFY